MYKKVFYTLITMISLFAASANAAPMAYSVNSDGQEESTWDSLYLIDLATSGSEQRRGPLFSGVYNHFDTEGLAFSPDGTLWGVDDDSRILFPINTTTGSINFTEVIQLFFLPPPSSELGGNDFGMTFACDGSLYLTSVATNLLYKLDLEGNYEVVGSLGANISAIAAIGNPTRLYGLGNGLLDNGQVDSPNLYSIDVEETGAATAIGPLTNAQPYHEGGLTFDSEGNLWAITDRSGLSNQPSQVLSINVDTGLATVVSTTTETGFESLAITPPSNCEAVMANDRYPAIPVLHPLGLLTFILALIFSGIAILHRRFS
ncbi:MAG: esterase-like activity of phytase family protein [Xanthomonadales bacterium]|nr:esterase-like activity of phytase family protein [Xanthomonadales bacterium]